MTVRFAVRAPPFRIPRSLTLVKKNPDFKLRGQKPFKKLPPLEDPGNRLPGTAEINSAISMLNATGNAIAAYEICCLCAKHGRAWPEPLMAFIINSVFKPLVEAGKAGETPSVTNIVLNLRSNDGGRDNLFGLYRRWHSYQKAMRRCDEEMLKTRFARQRQKDGKPLKPPTKTSVYAKIAKETGFACESIKRWHEDWDKSQASFSIGALDRAHAKARKQGLVELE